jgi:ribosomal protein S18 acetylase RimI-like enzyme
MNPQVRELTADDVPQLREFFAEMPAEDRTFFFYDVDDPSVVEAYAQDERRLRRCAVDENGRILALANLNPGVDWSSHVAELVLLVAPGARRRGLGRMMARTMLIEAVSSGFKKVTVMIAADSVGAVDMFRKLGFEGEALLRDHLRNPEDGELRDTVILAHLVDDSWSTMMTGGFEEAVA